VAASLGGCVKSGRSAPTPDGWSLLSCSTCRQDRIEMNVRRSVTDAGRRGTHLVARVRNLNRHAVVFVAHFQVDVAPDSEGYVPGEQARLILGPASTATAEALVLLGRTDIVLVSISRLERVADMYANVQ